MGDTQSTVENYFNMWNEADPNKRASIIKALWTEEGVSVDPIASVKGHGEIAAMVAKVQGDYPGHRFNLVGEVTEHYDRAHFRWEMRNAESEVQLAGLDCVRLEESRIADLVGFWV